MNLITNNELSILKNELNYSPNAETIEKLNLWANEFKNYNSHTNLMSKNDIDVLFGRHVFDSLALLKCPEFKPLSTQKIADIGTGGGFPSVILAICFPSVQVAAVESRIKKINFLKEIKEKLNLENLDVIHARSEDIPPLNADIVLSRAVGKIKDVYEISKKHIKKGGVFLIYKSQNFEEEVNEFKKTYKFNFHFAEYNLPIEQNSIRHLVYFRLT